MSVFEYIGTAFSVLFVAFCIAVVVLAFIMSRGVKGADIADEMDEPVETDHENDPYVKWKKAAQKLLSKESGK